ncbi:YrhB domain-containing protein [Rhodoblastus acidophilus]|uniref:YrhB domain-containing protein n=1 Tax=Rhodoblastus acidophilus TaxID=1074 RepID=UPI001304C848|nr:YrhB domain-containing protein [Rhodoblastus acidophilus]MCW2317647.1 hypothetical protein [Rhodoblastus acidophilus]
MEKITINQARLLALEYLTRAGENADILLIPGKEREYPFGWIFFGASRKYVETGDFRYQIPGLGPLAVEFDGSVHSLSTSGSPDAVIEAYSQRWRERHEKSR